MNEPELSRRKVLSSLAVAGGAGSLVGGGTGAFVTNALFSDSETFAGNTIRTSENVGGVVDIDVGTDKLNEEGEGDENGVKYTISLPDPSSGNKNNPAYVWLRTKDCPDPEELELAKRTKIDPKISYEPDDNADYVRIFDEEKSVFEVLNDIRSGINLGSFGPEEDSVCLQPGEKWHIKVEADVTDEEEFKEDTEGEGGSETDGFPGKRDFPGKGKSPGNRSDQKKVSEKDHEGDKSLEFELEFYAQQCRYQSGSTNPFDSKPDCGNTDGGTKGKGISFIAFCGPTGMNPSVSIPEDAERDESEDGAPTSLDWETAEGAPVTYVSVKAGNNWTIYDYTGGENTDGTAETGDDPDAAFFGHIDGEDGVASEPCEVAKRRVENGTAVDESIKFEWKEDKQPIGEHGKFRKEGDQ